MLTRNKGDLDDGEDVSKRAAWAGGGLAGVIGAEGANGNGSVCDGSSEMDERISMTEEGTKFVAPGADKPPSI